MTETKYIILPDWYWWIIIGALFIMIISFIIVYFYFSVKDKIHDSYHKGFNQATNDNLTYYATIKTLIEKYNDIEILLKQDDFKFSLELSNKLNTYKKILKEFQEV